MRIRDSLPPPTGVDAGEGCVIDGPAVRACIPAAAVTKDGADIEGDALTFDRLCYRVRCADEDEDTLAAPRSVDDALGRHEIRAGKTKLVCTPATLTIPGTKNRRFSGASGGGGSGAAATETPDCGDATEDGNLTASDALNVLKAAVGTRACLICVCDVENNAKITASDALRLLRFAVGQSVTLDCQADGNPIAWDGGGDGSSWIDPLNWNLDRIPNLCDDATIASGSTVVHPSGTNGVRNISATSAIDLNGGTLTMRGAASVAGLFRLRGANLTNAEVIAPGNDAPLVLTNSGGTLTNATVSSKLDLSAPGAYSYIVGGLTLEGATTIGSNSGLYFQGTGEQMLDGNATITIAGGNAQIYNYGGTSLHIGPDISVVGPGAVVGGNQVNTGMTIDGLVSVNAAGTTTVGTVGPWTNKGTLAASNSGILTLQGPWNNDGTVTLDATGTLNLGGAFHSSDVGTINRSGGTVNLTGEMKNTGTSFTIDAAKGIWRLVGGKVTGGTLAYSGGGKLQTTASGGILSGVTFANGLDVSTAGSYSYVQNGITLEGTTTIGSNAGLFFQGTGEQALNGAGTINFSGSTAQLYNYGGTLLHIGPDITMLGPGGIVGGNQASSTMTIDGVVNVNAAGSTIVGTAGAWTSTGTLAATNGGILNLTGPWSSTGTLELGASSTINLGGVFPSDGIGSIDRSGGTLNVTGQMNNASKTYTMTAATGDFRLVGGKISGGTLASSGGAKLLFTASGGTLDALTLDATSEFPAGAYTYVTNGLTLTENVSIASNAGFFFQGTGEQNLGGTATITFTGSTAQVYNYGGTTLHIGSGISMVGAGGVVGGNQSTARMTNDGSIVNSSAGTTIVGSADVWTNTGTIGAAGSGILTLTGPWTSTGTFALAGSGVLNLGGTFASSGFGSITRSGGTMNLTGQMNNSAATFTLDATKGSMLLVGGKIVGGTIAQTGGAKLLFTASGGTLDGVSVPAGIEMQGGAYSYVQNGITLGGSSTIAANAGLYFQGSGTQNLAGTGTITFTGANAQLYNYAPNTLQIAAGLTIEGAGGVVGGNQSGSHLANLGTIRTTSSGLIDVGTTDTWTTTGTLDASGGDIRTRGSWANDGSIHVGAGRALLASTNFAQNGGGNLTLDLQGTAASAFGKVTVSGTATLGGTLNIVRTNGYVPNLADSFVILTATSVSGSFATVNGLAIDGTKKFSVVVGPTSVTLTVVPA